MKGRLQEEAKEQGRWPGGGNQGPEERREVVAPREWPILQRHRQLTSTQCCPSKALHLEPDPMARQAAALMVWQWCLPDR